MEIVSKIKTLTDSIRRNWDQMAPSALAEKIIEVEDLVAKTNLPALAKAREEVKKFHFNFVFPITRDFQGFSKRIEKLADKILKEGTFRLFAGLSATQQKEITRES